MAGGARSRIRVAVASPVFSETSGPFVAGLIMQPSSQTPISQLAEKTVRTGRRGLDELPVGAFLIFVGTIFFLLVILQCVWIVHVTFGPGTMEPKGAGLNWLWGLLTFATLVLGVLNAFWGVRSLKAFQRSAAYNHFGILLCCGLAAIGLQCLTAARALSREPLRYDFSHLGESALRSAAAAPMAAKALPGDAEEGKKLFAMTCITCHGPTGDGLNNLAPSLRISEFIKSADIGAITNVVKRGRPANDPNNKTGKVMPARGGNPFLTDQQVAHLVAFVTGLPNSSAPSTRVAVAGAAPAVQLSRWVLPAAKFPPPGLIALDPSRELIGSEAIEKKANERRAASLNALGLQALAVHGIFLTCLFLASSGIVFAWLLDVHRVGQAQWLAATNWGWVIALVAWGTILFAFGAV